VLPVLQIRRRSHALLCAQLLLGPVFATHTLDLATATIPELQQAYTDGLTAERVVQVYLQRIAAYDQAGPKLNAILRLNPDAVDEARALDAERRAKGPRSLLHGVPILVKDNFDTADLPTTGGARALAGTYPAADAPAVARLRAAGAIVLAKTNLDEFARGATGTSSLGGQTLNPYNPDKIPGGSSAGTAVGITALFGWAGVGTETGSSIRNPATKNNVVGFCPSEGLVSRRGIIPQSPIFDRAGTLARNVTDAAILMGFMAGADPADLFTLAGLGRIPADGYRAALRVDGLKGARIGVLRQLCGGEPEDQPALALVNAAIARLKEQGAVVVDPLIADVDLWQRVRDVSGGDGLDSRVGLEAYFATRGREFPVKTLGDLLARGGILGRLRGRYERDLQAPDPATNSAYRENYEARLALRRFVTDLMEREHLDALIYPHETKPARSLAEEVPDGGASPGPPDKRRAGRGNTISSATGLPTIVVPVGFNIDGVGVGLEFLGRRFDEVTVIRLAFAYEQAAPHRQLPMSTPLLGGEVLSY
jgi:amidase